MKIIKSEEKKRADASFVEFGRFKGVVPGRFPPVTLRLGTLLSIKVLICTGLLLTTTFLMPVFADTAQKVQKQVKQSIDTRQKTQKQTEEWNAQKVELTTLYDRLFLENEALATTNRMLSKEETKQMDLNNSLEKQKFENLRIQKEMLPFLKSVMARLDTLVENDAPFLQIERETRLKKLKSVMEDIDVTIAEKYRKIMEALSVEAEYGNTIEVYQEKIKLSGNEVLGNIFRLGRVSMFFLSFDESFGALFNVKENKWVILDENYIPAIKASVDMAAKRRPVELISLPLGRIAKQ